jgi:hypothetical protein
LIVDQVTYDDDAPWPAAADGGGPSLQLIDALQDNNRAANWAVSFVAGQTNPPQQLLNMTASWRYNQTANLDGVNWMAPGYNDSAWPSGPALLYVETAALPEPKNTLLTLGVPQRITYYFRTYFNYTGSVSGVSLVFSNLIDDGAVFYLNGSEIGRVGMNSGTVSYNTFSGRSVTDATAYDVLVVQPNNLIQGSNTLAVEVHQINTNSTDIVFGSALRAVSSGTSPMYTPTMANSVRATLPAFPKLWLNEVLPNNTMGLTDRFGDRDPWVELYNGGATNISLNGYYLANQYSNLTQWPFPSTASIGPGQFLLVWLDGEPGESIASELHANFRINSTTGSVALVKGSPAPMIIDHINYNVASAGRSYGDYPDGNVSGRKTFSIITPGATNNAAGAVINVFINEWMADNTTTLPDPADGDYEDWIELYNPDNDPVDLSGYFLTDVLTNTTAWEFPQGSIIPAHGYLLVWADGETGQNDPPLQPFEPHANFSLSKNGEAIGLYGAGGVLIDAVTFGPQTNGISQGRFPDGQSRIEFMTPTPRTANFAASASNSPPSIGAIADRNANEGSLLTFTVAATDPDAGQSLTFSLDPGAPSGALINATNGVFSWVPSEAQGPGNYTITIRVTDNGSPNLTAARSFTVHVSEVNNPPTLSGIPDRNITEGNLLTVTPSASDSDAPAQTLTFSLDPTPPAGVLINTTNGVVTWTPTEAQGPGTYFITVRVTDDGEPPLSDTKTFTVIVNESNTAPVLALIANQTNAPGTTIGFTASATDVDLPPQTLAYSLDAGAPASASINPSTGAFSWTPGPADAGTTNVITARVTDNGSPALSHARSFTIVVTRELKVTDIDVAGGVVTLTWSSVPGKTYRLQRKRDLNDAWANTGGTINATTTTTTTTDSVGANTRQFYRILQTN